MQLENFGFTTVKMKFSCAICAEVHNLAQFKKLLDVAEIFSQLTSLEVCVEGGERACSKAVCAFFRRFMSHTHSSVSFSAGVLVERGRAVESL